jgi:ribonuclease P protein component
MMSDQSLPRFTLGREERLKSGKKIKALFAAGKVIAIPPFRLLYQLHNEKSPLQMGVAVSTRHFKKAVDRNRIKRLIREAYRLQKNELKQQLEQQERGLSLFIIYTGKSLPDYAQVFEKTGKLLEQLCKKTDEVTQ